VSSPLEEDALGDPRHYPAFSPDGTRIVFNRDLGPPGRRPTDHAAAGAIDFGESIALRSDGAFFEREAR
jgi:hypothetical protein